jgi:pSer/pThr/pTyr-binding forkhead associated (FHA) protein
MRVGSPEGLNPFGATVGPAQGSPGAQGPAPAPPGWPPPDAAHAATAPPATADDYDAHKAAPPPKPTNPPAAPQHSVGQATRDPEHVDPNAPRALAAFLVSYEGNELGTFYPIHQGQNLVGRKGAAPGLNVEIEHGTTSSRHAMLLASARPGRVKIEDVGSTNGTFVGELMLERGKKHELKDGDVVRFGGYVTIVKIV